MYIAPSTIFTDILLSLQIPGQDHSCIHVLSRYICQTLCRIVWMSILFSMSFLSICISSHIMSVMFQIYIQSSCIHSCITTCLSTFICMISVYLSTCSYNACLTVNIMSLVSCIYAKPSCMYVCNSDSLLFHIIHVCLPNNFYVYNTFISNSTYNVLHNLHLIMYNHSTYMYTWLHPMWHKQVTSTHFEFFSVTEISSLEVLIRQNHSSEVDETNKFWI